MERGRKTDRYMEIYMERERERDRKIKMAIQHPDKEKVRE